MAAQVGDIFIAEMRVLHPAQQPFEPGADAVAGLVRAVVGIVAKEVLEVGAPLVQPGPEIDLGHRELVHVGEEDPLHRLLLG